MAFDGQCRVVKMDTRLVVVRVVKPSDEQPQDDKTQEAKSQDGKPVDESTADEQPQNNMTPKNKSDASSIASSYDGPECRICFSGPSPSNRFISPCKCTGTLKYIHLKCFISWQSTDANKPCCDLCRQPFRSRKQWKPRKEVNKISLTIFSLKLHTPIQMSSNSYEDTLLIYYHNF